VLEWTAFLGWFATGRVRDPGEGIGRRPDYRFST